MSSSHRAARNHSPLACAMGCGRNASPVSSFCVPCGAGLDAVIFYEDLAATSANDAHEREALDLDAYAAAVNDDGREEPAALVGVLHVPGRRCATCNGAGEVRRPATRWNPTGLEDCPDPRCTA